DATKGTRRPTRPKAQRGRPTGQILNRYRPLALTGSGRYAARGMGASFLSNRWWAASMSSQQQIQAKHELLRPFLKGRLRRLWAAAEALEIGPAGIKRVAEAIGMSTTTVKLGMRELRATAEAQPAKTKTEDESRRRTGRPRCDEKDPGL